MNNIPAFSNDPIIRYALDVVIVSCAAFISGNLGWWTVKNVAKGFGQLGDRRRKIKHEQEDAAMKRQAELIRAAAEIKKA